MLNAEELNSIIFFLSWVWQITVYQCRTHKKIQYRQYGIQFYFERSLTRCACDFCRFLWLHKHDHQTLDSSWKLGLFSVCTCILTSNIIKFKFQQCPDRNNNKIFVNSGGLMVNGKNMVIIEFFCVQITDSSKQANFSGNRRFFFLNPCLLFLIFLQHHLIFSHVTLFADSEWGMFGNALINFEPSLCDSSLKCLKCTIVFQRS